MRSVERLATLVVAYGRRGRAGRVGDALLDRFGQIGKVRAHG